MRTGDAPWAARSRRHPPWAPSCAAGTSALDQPGALARAGRWGRTRRRAVHHRPRARPTEAKEGARHHGYTGKRHPLLHGTGDVLMFRLTQPTPPAAPPTSCRPLRTTHATGRQRVLHSWRGIRLRHVRFSITIRQHKSLRNLIEAIPEDLTPIPYWMDGAADVTCTPFQVSRTPHRCGSVVRQLALFASYSYLSASCTRGDARTGGRSSPPRRDRECYPRPQARCGVEPSPLGPLRRQRRLDGGTGPQPRPLDSAHRPGRAGGQDPPAAVLLPGRNHPLGAASLCLPQKPSSVPWPCAPCHSLPDGGGGNRPPSGQPNVPANSESGLRCCVLSPLSDPPQRESPPN